MGTKSPRGWPALPDRGQSKMSSPPRRAPSSPSPASERIACLDDGARDLVVALGWGDRIVPVPMRTSLERAPAADPARVDLQVSDAVAEGLPIVEAAIPDDATLVVTTKGGHVRLGPTRAEVWELDVSSLGALLAILDGRPLGDALRGRLGLIEPAPSRRVVALSWGDPPYGVHGAACDAIELAGGQVAFRGCAPIDGHALVDADPDVMLYLPCDYTLDEAEAEAHRIVNRVEAQRIAAVRRGDVWALDPALLRSSPSRAVELVEVARQVLCGISGPRARRVHGAP